MNRRNTIQRDLVLGAVRELGCHATAEEVYGHIAENYPSISKGTVYRNLAVLVDEGAIRRVEIPQAADCFDHVCERHYHVRCVACGKVYDVDMEWMGDLTERVRDMHGFDFLEYDLVFKGVCPACKDKAAADAGGQEGTTKEEDR